MWLFKQNLHYFFLNLGFTNQDLIYFAILVGIAVMAFWFTVRYVVSFFLSSLENQFNNGRFKIWLNIFSKLQWPILLLNGLFAASFIYLLPQQVNSFFDNCYLLITVIFAITVLRLVISDFIQVYLRTRGKVSEEAIKTVVNFANVVSLIVLSIAAVIIFLQISHVDSQALLGGLGIASVIVAFSFQSMLKDIFAFFSIYVDRSFSVGDYIIYDNIEGTIKEIRLRSTKIAALGGQDIIVPNYNLTTNTIQNYNRLKKRRVSIEFFVENDLSVAKTEKLISELKKMLSAPEFALKIDPVTTVLYRLSVRGFQFRIVYRFNNPSYLEHLEYKEKVNLAIMKILADNKVKLTTVPDFQQD